MIFLLLAWMGAALTLPAQTGRLVSAELKEVPLSAALKKLEQASGCSILFTYSDVQPYRVTASIREMAVEQAVKKLLEGKPLTSVRRGEEYLIVLPDSVHRLPAAVQGRVTDEADRPLPYSNVLTAYLVVLHILQLIPFVRLFSLSKQNQATRSYHLASSSFVRLLQATTKYWQWVTAQSTSNRLRMIWWRSLLRQLSVLKSSVSILRTMTAWMRWLHRWLNFVKVK